MMYIDAVCDGIDDIPTIDDQTRETMKRRLKEEGLEALVEELKRLDPDYYEIVDRQNPRRVVHALSCPRNLRDDRQDLHFVQEERDISAAI